jgi:hypothetical protein
MERREAVMRGRAPRAYRELNALRWLDVLQDLDPERQDPLRNPWRWRYGAAVRRALGH